MISALYYPFSRPISASSMKQMLLLFDEVSFLEPIKDDNVRFSLFKVLADNTDRNFRGYEEIKDVFNTFQKEKIINFIDPQTSSAFKSLPFINAIKQDLEDPNWKSISSRFDKFNIPHQKSRSSSKPYWVSFKGKIPGSVLEGMETEEDIKRNVYGSGALNSTVNLSYSLGSSISINTHLAIAQDLGLVPLTDSLFHFHLLMLKVMRDLGEPDYYKKKELLEQIAEKISIQILDSLFSPDDFRRIDFDQILLFRENTKHLRSDFFVDLKSNILSTIGETSPNNIYKWRDQLINSLESELKDYRLEMINLKRKTFPALAKIAFEDIGSTTLAGLLIGLILGGIPGAIFGASIPLMGKVGIDIWEGQIDKSSLKAKRSPAITFLSTIENQLK